MIYFSKTKMFQKILGVLLFLIILFACSKPNKNKESQIAALYGNILNTISIFNPFPLLFNLSNNVILKSYSDLEVAANEFNSTVQAFNTDCSNDASNLLLLQSQWKKNIATVKEIELIQFGPAQFGGFYESIDPWVATYTDNATPDTSSIESFIAGVVVINATNVSVLNKLQKGLPAIEYLLFTDASATNSKTVICSGLTSRRLEFLKQLVLLYYTATKNLHNQWKITGSNFAKELPNAGNVSIYFTSQKSALDTLFLQITNHIEFIRDNKIGYPAGFTIRSGGTIHPTIVESRFSNQSIENLGHNLIGINNLYTGSVGPGLSDFVKSVNPKLDQKIKTQIITCISDLQTISNLSTAIVSNQSDVRKVYASLTTLRNLFLVELSATLGSGGGGSGSSGDGD